MTARREVADGSEGCPARADLERFAAAGRVDAALRDHVASCAGCAQLVAEIEAENALLFEFVSANRDRIRDGRALARADAPEGYEILEEIHRGSQGVVHRAIQTATRRTVALKIMLQGAFATERQRKRFEREVELVASLRHRNIVTVFDSGIDPDGRHYLAMEFVPGVPLDEHLGGIRPSVRDVLVLFARVCDAVAFAHQRGIIHRDLKPANIIVDEAGEPRVLDFGLAKLIGPDRLSESVLETVAGEFLGTFAYAAPEQVAGDPSLVDTRTDVHALGVVLYEMLTGRRPFELAGSVRDVVETIAEAEPRRPSAVRPDLPYDVEAIVLKSLAKDPDRRYQSARALLDDVRRFLDGEPIDVRRGETMYVLRKAIVRHKGPVAAGALLLALLVAFGVTMWFMYLAQLEEGRRTTRTMESLVGVIALTDQENPDSPLPVVSIIQLLDEASRIVEAELGDLPEVAAAVRTSLGLAYMSYTELEEAERHLAFALATYDELHRAAHPDRARALHNLGRLRWKTARYAEAEDLYRRALAMRSELYPDGHADVARTMHHLASTLRFEGRYEESERWFRAALEMRRRVLEPDDPDIGNTLNGLGNCLLDMGRPDDALAHHRQGLDMLAGARDFRSARVKHNIARCLLALGRLDEAETTLLDSLGIKIARERPPEESVREAGAYLARALGGEEEIVVVEDPGIANALHLMARLRLAQGDRVQAERYCRRALSIRRSFFEEDTPDVVASIALSAEIRASTAPTPTTPSTDP